MPAMKPSRYSFCSGVKGPPGTGSRVAFGRFMGAKHQTPTTKHQQNSNPQPPGEVPAPFDTGLELGAWDFFGVWCLVFGVSFRLFQSHRAELQLRLAGDGIVFTVSEGIDATVFVVQLSPMKRHEQCAGANAVVAPQCGARKAAPGHDAYPVAVL